MQGTSKRFYLQDQANTFWGGMYCYDYRLDNGDTIRTGRRRLYPDNLEGQGILRLDRV